MSAPDEVVGRLAELKYQTIAPAAALQTPPDIVICTLTLLIKSPSRTRAYHVVDADELGNVAVNVAGKKAMLLVHGETDLPQNVPPLSTTLRASVQLPRVAGVVVR